MRVQTILCSALMLGSLSAQSTITVTNTEEFLNAIGSNKTIVLKEGTYNLSDFEDKGSSQVTWLDDYDGKQPKISEVSNLKLTGKGNVRILVKPRYTWVFILESCKNVSMENITFGHTEGGYCSGGVIDLEYCENIKMTNCKLFGSGTYGIQMNYCRNVEVTGCDVYKCTYGLLILNYSKYIQFTKTRFRETGEFDLISIEDCDTVNFKSCVFEKNTAGAYFFVIDNNYGYEYEIAAQSTGITINTCTFRDNDVTQFSNDFRPKLMLGDNRFERNTFPKPLPTPTRAEKKNSYDY